MKSRIAIGAFVSIFSVLILFFLNDRKMEDTEILHKKLDAVSDIKEDYLKLKNKVIVNLKNSNEGGEVIFKELEAFENKFNRLRGVLIINSTPNVLEKIKALDEEIKNLKKHVQDILYKNVFAKVKIINEQITLGIRTNKIQNTDFRNLAMDIALNTTYMVFFNDETYIRKVHNLQRELMSKDWGEDNKLAEKFIKNLSDLLSDYEDFRKDYIYIVKNNQIENILNDLEDLIKEDLAHVNLKYLYIEELLFALFLISSGYLFIRTMQLISNNDKLDDIRRRLNEALEIDDLTGLKNRYAFIKEKKQYKLPTLILINIDNFKHINDSYGSNVGDHVLRELGKKLKDFIIAKGLKGEVYRLGADDFGILIDDYQNKKKLESLVKELITMIENSEFKYSGIEIPIKVTAGISNETPLLETADIALKEVKRSRNKYMFYSEDMNIRDRIVKNINTIRLIKNALNEDRIFLVFQPIKNLRTDEIDKFEVLVRLQDDKGRILYPGEFLDIAKEAKYYGEITKVVLEKTFNLLKEKDITLSVNLSLEDIIDDNIRSLINKNIKNPKIGRNLIFEILEDENIENYQKEFLEFIKEVKEHDVRIAIDDFGSGYSNFSHLLKLKPDYIKVDGRLIKEIDIKEENRVITETIVEFAHKLDIETVAEFVWNNDILKVVKEIGFDYAQGFAISKPIPLEVLEIQYLNKD